MVLPSPTGASSSSSTLGSSISDTASSHETDSTKESTARLHQPQHESTHHTHQLSFLSLCHNVKDGGKPIFWTIQEGNQVNTAALNLINPGPQRLAVLYKERVSGVQLDEGAIAAATVSSDGNYLAVAYHCCKPGTATSDTKIYLICIQPTSVDMKYHISLDSVVTALSFGKDRDIYAGTTRGEIFRIVDGSGNPTPIECSLNGDEILSMVYSHRVLPKGLLLIATTARVCIVRLDDRDEPVWVGSRGHHGRFGGTLLNDGRVCCARPGGRIWLADINLLDDSCNYTTLSVQNTLKFSSNNGKSISLGMLWVVTERHVLSIASGSSKQRAYLLDVETVEVAYEFLYISPHNSLPIVSVSSLGPQLGVLLHIGAYNTSPSITALIKPNVIGMPPHITLLSISLLSPSPHPRSLPARLPIPTLEGSSIVSGSSSSRRCSKTHSLADRCNTEDGLNTNDTIEVLNLSNFPRAIDTGFTDQPMHCRLRNVRLAHPSDGITSLPPSYSNTTSFISTYLRTPASRVDHSVKEKSYGSVDRVTVYQLQLRARLLSLASCLANKHSGFSSIVEEELATPRWVIAALEADWHSLVEVNIVKDELYEAFSVLGWAAAQRAISRDDDTNTPTPITSRRKCDEIRWKLVALGDKHEEVTQYLKLSPHTMLHPRLYMDILMDHTVPLELMMKYPPGIFLLSDAAPIALSQALDALSHTVPRQSSPNILRFTNRQEHQDGKCECLAYRVLHCLSEHDDLTVVIKSLGAILPLFLVHAIVDNSVAPLEDILLALEVSQVPLDDETLTLLWEHAWSSKD